jgi:hypothetical protein
MIKFDAIEFGLKINVRAKSGIDAEKKIRNLSIAVGFLAVISAAALGFIIYERWDPILGQLKKLKKN